MTKLRVIEPDSPLHPREIARREVERYRYQRAWTLGPQPQVPNEDQIIRRATRHVDALPEGRVSATVAFWSGVGIVLIIGYAIYQLLG
jgi:hypothetical protein